MQTKRVYIEGLEAELTMSKNVILRKMRFKVSITAKKIRNFNSQCNPFADMFTVLF